MVQYCVLIMVSFLVSSCGKKGPVEPLEQSDYPHTYPKPPQPDSSPLKTSKKALDQ